MNHTVDAMLAEVAHAERQIDAGHYIRHEDVMAWLLSWGTDHEVPPPNCVCGESQERHLNL